MKALIFGVTGQDGYYLSKLLTKNNYLVIGVSRKKGDWISGDVSDLKFVENIIKAEKPDIVFHLAANSTTRHDALFENHETISTGTLNILESVYKFHPKCKVFLSGSAMQFANNGSPIDEHTPFEASSPYAVARIQSTYAARYYRSKGLEVYMGYFFIKVTNPSPAQEKLQYENLIRSAELGYMYAELELGYKYYYKKDYDKAIELFKKAADRGCRDANFSLADMYLGVQITPNLDMAISYFGRAMSHGCLDTKLQFVSSFWFHLRYFHEVETQALKEILFDFIKQRARAGCIAGLLKLAEIYDEDFHNKKAAAKFYQMAVNKGSIEAKVQLAILYMSEPLNSFSLNVTAGKKLIDELIQCSYEVEGLFFFRLARYFERGRDGFEKDETMAL